MRPPLCLQTRLPHPPGINASYRAGQGRFWMTPAAKAWKADAILLLRAAGARSQPPGAYRLAVELTLCTRRLDLDAPIKLCLDAVSVALGIDDSAIQSLAVTKQRAESLALQYLDVFVSVEMIDATAAPRARSEPTYV